MELPFQQVFVPGDLPIIGMLIIMEGVLSIDNALVLGLLAKRLPKFQQSRALTYGLIGAFVFRFIAIATAQFLLRWTIVKLIGGGYLLYVALKYFLFESHEDKSEHIEVGPDGQPILVDDETGGTLTGERLEDEIQARTPLTGALPEMTENPYQTASPHVSRKASNLPGRVFANFWKTVVVIELTDIAFAIDSIMAAIGMVPAAPAGHVGFDPKLWVIVTGGMLGVILMRYAAVVFIKLLERFPRFEISAYLLVAVIGVKLVADWGFNPPGPIKNLDFHSPTHWEFWAFWIAMLASLAVGFIPKKAVAKS